MLVKELMNDCPPVVDAACCIKEAIPLMSVRGSSCIIIVEDSKPIGIVTERDITKLFTSLLVDSHYPEHAISKIMTPAPVCVQENSLFKDALMLSRSRKLRHLPVINNDQHLVGIVTQSNLVDAYVRLIDRHAELETSVEELKLLSLEDALLGIGNRRAMEVDLNHTEQHALRNRSAYSLALLDIDFFKKYNDHYGHQSGDKTLRQVAQAVKSTLRASDRVFRYGGEELLILMPGSIGQQARICAERVKQAVKLLEIPHSQSPEGVLTVSIGVAETKIEAWQNLLKQADEALYQAKNQGRNRVVVAPSSS